MKKVKQITGIIIAMSGLIFYNLSIFKNVKNKFVTLPQIQT